MVVWQQQAAFTAEEVARILDVDVSVVHRLIRLGELGACRVQDTIGVPPQLLKDYQRQTTVSSAA